MGPICGVTCVTTPRPLVLPSLNKIVVPGFRYSGLYMNLNLTWPLSPVRSRSLLIETTLAACQMTPQWKIGYDQILKIVKETPVSKELQFRIPDAVLKESSWTDRTVMERYSSSPALGK